MPLFALGSGHNGHSVRFVPGKIKNSYFFVLNFKWPINISRLLMHFGN